MPPLNKKVKAFTIAEMLVVLVVSVIVIALAMIVLGMVQQQIRIVNNNYDKQTEIRLLERTLLNDFNKHQLYYNNNKKELTCISEIDTVNYIFSSDFIKRNNDTLSVPIIDVVVFLDGDVIKNNEIDALELQLSKEIEEKTIFVSKTKDASYYLNKENGI
ncbi:hypothetical protein [Aureibaculum luteum]|uniref:hypothetical protein n=1 Tax=Aureibaculum luteum TaxID=1548456 RepID=UPI000E4F275F|nr:hypothetical protein [Aureibaculum luteum]